MVMSVTCWSTGNIWTNAGGSDVWTAWRNRFDRNTYVLPAGGEAFWWQGGATGRADWVSAGNDVNGVWLN